MQQVPEYQLKEKIKRNKKLPSVMDFRCFSIKRLLSKIFYSLVSSFVSLYKSARRDSKCQILFQHSHHAKKFAFKQSKSKFLLLLVLPPYGANIFCV